MSYLVPPLRACAVLNIQTSSNQEYNILFTLVGISWLGLSGESSLFPSPGLLQFVEQIYGKELLLSL